MQEISPQEFVQKQSAGESLLLVDVRTPGEFASVHAQPAVNIPLDSLNEARVSEEAKGRRVAFICKGGTRSKRACQAVNLDSFSLQGGTDAWVAAGLPVVRGQGVISLERQVRIAAGVFILLGVVSTVLFHPAFIAVPAFIGAGLVFAGITDWCGMGLLLARCPWNCGSGSCTQPNK